MLASSFPTCQEQGFTKILARTRIEVDAPVPCPVTTQVHAVYTTATRKAEDQGDLELMVQESLSLLAKLNKGFDDAVVGYNGAKRLAETAVDKAECLAVRLSTAEIVAANARWKMNTKRVVAKEAQTAFEEAAGALANAQMASSTREKKVGAARRHHADVLAKSKEADARVGTENLRHILRTEIDLAVMMGLTEQSRKDVQRFVHSHLAKDENFVEWLDHRVHDPEFLKLHDGYTNELSPEDQAFVNEMGTVAADMMSAATKAAVSEAEKTMDPEVRVYIPSILEATTLARREEMFVRETVKLAALRRRRCVRQRASAALSVAVEKAARDLNEAIAELASSNAVLGEITRWAGAARETFDLAEKDVRIFGAGSRKADNTVRSLQQQLRFCATEQEGLEAAVRQAEVTLDEARSATGSAAELECDKYVRQLRGWTE